ncbi:MAG TPA: class I SAM-dependent methyltransferase, partial [Candidatus Krumholzibacteriaceae bacterium]|nr:class I SAM-dependent methyltransferase [Candidatus Krumholzibacteriaceae bacterium]
ERMRHCYEIASPRVKQYLEAEIQFVLERLDSTDAVLELGCGYGRVVFRLAEVANRVVGIDNAVESLELARQLSSDDSKCEFIEMDALELTFDDCEFDKVVCIQNGISAFGVDQESLLRQALRVTRPGGSIYLSSYSERFWEDRLSWFEAQSDAGLMGEIDYDETGNNIIVCKDGFRTGIVRPDEFHSLSRKFGLDPKITEVDESSVFCEIEVAKVV